MSLTTPRRDVRRLTFTSTGSQNPFSNPLPSPYTPFSGRKSGSVPPGTPQLREPAPDNALPPEPLEEAQRYIDGDLIAVLRGAAIDNIKASHRMSAFGRPVDTALSYVSATITSLEAQLDLSDTLADARSQRPYVRNALRTLNTTLRLECNTWILLQTAWRAPDLQNDDLSTRRLKPTPLDAETIANVPGYAKLQRIVEWFERTADDALERTGGPRLKPLDDPAYRWEYTAARDHNDKPISMDAPCKGQPLDEIERKAEARLSREVYRLVRAGRLDEAEEVCRRVGQPWRAAALAGGKRGTALAANGVKGLARQTWRKAAAAIARSSSNAITPHERAVCGVLAGVLEPVLAVADGYDDEAWARLSILLEGAAEKVLSGAVSDARIEDETILQAFRECQNPGRGVEDVSSELLEEVRKVQAYVGLGPGINGEHLKSLLEALSQLAQTAMLQSEEWACRFAAQICLFLKLSGMMSEGDLHPDMFDHFDTAVQSYVKLVIKMDLEAEEQASRHGAILPARPLVCTIAAYFLAEVCAGRRTIETYAELLCAALRADLHHERAEAERAGVESKCIEERRTLCLKKAGQCFTKETLDELVIAALESIWQENMPSRPTEDASTTGIAGEGAAGDRITDQDELVVRAIEFLLFPEFPNYNEALLRATRAARRFFLLGRREAAKHVIRWFPRDALKHVEPDNCAAAIHEFDCWDVYFDAVQKHNDWNIFHTSKRPRALPESVRSAALAQPGQVSYNDQTSAKIKLQDYLHELEEFNRVCSKNRDVAIEGLRAALLFSGGWMNDMASISEESDMVDAVEDEQQRVLEVEAVRRFGIPQLAMLLHHVLDESRMYADAVELATVIAREDSQLYESFGQTEIRAFLSQIANSAVLLADETVRSEGLQRPYEGKFFEEMAT